MTRRRCATFSGCPVQSDDKYTVVIQAGGGRPLKLPAGTSALWAWLGSDSDPDPRALRVVPGYYASWAEAAIEGGPVGRVAVVVSTARLEAGDELKRKMLEVQSRG